MDNAMIERLYNRGIRAYVSDRGNYFDEPPIDPDDPDDGGATPFSWAYKDGDEIWHALRAYQDDQRKKGVPIKFTFMGGADWDRRSYGGFDFVASSEGPVILVSADPLRIMDEPWGQFTNFRWRAGYPKEKTAIQLAREAVDKPGVHWPGYPKGGQNG